MLTTIPYYSATGIQGIEWDAVELPSQFMENWCYHEPTLVSISEHIETKQPISHELFEKIKNYKNFRAATQLLRQISFSLLDMELHLNYDPSTRDKKSVFELQEEIFKLCSHVPILESDRFLCQFLHIFAGGYAAGYYSYKWAEVMSSDAFTAFEEAGLDKDDKLKLLGKRFRDTILSKGGSMHPLEVFIEFRGKEPNPDSLLKRSGLK